jgi:hypothetical protein
LNQPAILQSILALIGYPPVPRNSSKNQEEKLGILGRRGLVRSN